MKLPEWGGGRENEGDGRWIGERMRMHDYEHARSSERDRAPIILDDCEGRALQFWRLMR